MEVIVDLVLDWVERPRDYVMICIVNKIVREKRRNSVAAMSAVQMIGQCCDVQTCKFSDDIVKGLSQVMRFYSNCECLSIHLHPVQIHTRNGNPRLMEIWRYRIRDVIANFCMTCETMRRNGSRLRLEYQKDKTFSFDMSVWECITDDDMIMFDTCFNMYIDYPRQITDKGIAHLRGVRSLKIICGERLSGKGFLHLLQTHNLCYLFLFGFKDTSQYAQSSLNALTACHADLLFDCHLI